MAAKSLSDEEREAYYKAGHEILKKANADSKSEPMNVYQRVSKAMEMIGYLQKDKTNPQGWNYLSEAKVKLECQRIFVELGLVPSWRVYVERVLERTVQTRNGERAVVNVIVHAQLTLFPTEGEDSITCEGVGQGEDGSDKGVMQAQTAAIRECLKSLLIIPSDNDPEQDTAEKGMASMGRKPARQPKPKETPEQTVNKLLDSIKRADTMEVLVELKPAVQQAMESVDSDELADALKKAFLARKKELKSNG